jgi:hypothetical protein
VGEKMKKEEINQFDDDDGIYAIPRNPNDPKVKVRALWDYCKSKNIYPEELSQEEMKQFLVYPKKKPL